MYTKEPKSMICCLEVFHTTKTSSHSSPPRLQFFSLINIRVCEKFGDGMLLIQAKTSRKDQRLWRPSDGDLKWRDFQCVFCTSGGKMSTLSPEKRKHYTVFRFLNIGWSLIFCKFKTNPQRSFGLWRDNRGKKEGNQTLYLNWHPIQILTFYWKKSAAGTFILRIPSY